jgi:hypothetical protein
VYKMKLPKSPDWEPLPADTLERYSHRPVFIVGSTRSGTTLMRSIIDAHPAIYCPPCETFLFNSLNTTFNGFIWDDHYDQLPFTREAQIQWLRRFVLDLFAHLGEAAGKARWAEKTPSHVFFMEFISEAFPDSQFIHMVRNGRDVVKSIKNVRWGSKNTVENTRQWVNSIRAGRRVGTQLGPDRYHEVRFEELIDQREQTLREICRFLGEEWAPQMIDYHLPKNNSWGLQFAAFDKRRKIIGKYNALTLLDHLAFTAVGGSLMKELGYW